MQKFVGKKNNIPSVKFKTYWQQLWLCFWCGKLYQLLQLKSEHAVNMCMLLERPSLNLKTNAPCSTVGFLTFSGRYRNKTLVETNLNQADYFLGISVPWCYESASCFSGVYNKTWSFLIQDFFSKCYRFHRKLRIWFHVYWKNF